MEPSVVFVLILAMITFTMAPSCGQRIEASQNPLPVGSTVTLTSDVSVTVGTWFFGKDLIVFIVPGNTMVSNSSGSRMTFNSSTSSLTIRSLRTSDSGVYQLQAFNSFKAELTLNVQVPISGVTLKATETNLVEFNDTAVFMCSVSNGSSLSYVWMRDGSVITADERTQFSNDGAHLTITGVTRHDAGHFQCNVSNLLGYEVSPPLNLSISYGPSAAIMTIMPEGNIHKTRSNITLSCSTESSPSATILWMVNGMSLSNVGPQLQLEMVTESDSGHYKCLFQNTVTMRYNSTSATIKIVNPVTMVEIKPDKVYPIVDHIFTLTCETDGSVDSIIWMLGRSPVSTDNTRILSMDNTTLTFDPVKHSDNGHYHCVASNLLSHSTSANFTLEVFYGPDNMALTVNGQNTTSFPAGSNLTMLCSAQSNPPAQLQWAFKGQPVNNSGPMWELMSVTKDQSGPYFCLAFNNHTNLNSTITKSILIARSSEHAVNAWLLLLLILRVGLLH